MSSGSKEQPIECSGTYKMKELDNPRDLNENIHTETTKEQVEDFNIPKKHETLEQFWDTLHEWADITTFHGIRFVFDRNSTVFRR
jgi:hypothetical protein